MLLYHVRLPICTSQRSLISCEFVALFCIGVIFLVDNCVCMQREIADKYCFESGAEKKENALQRMTFNRKCIITLTSTFRQQLFKTVLVNYFQMFVLLCLYTAYYLLSSFLCLQSICTANLFWMLAQRETLQILLMLNGTGMVRKDVRFFSLSLEFILKFI